MDNIINLTRQQYIELLDQVANNAAGSKNAIASYI